MTKADTAPQRAVARVRVSLVILASMLAGCALNVPRLPSELPPQWQHAPESASASAVAPDLRGWWKAFNDPELDRLVDRALTESLSVRQAGLRIGAARALAGSAGKHFLPIVGAHTYSEPTPDSSASYFQLGFDAKWELGLFGRSKSQERVAAANLGIAESDAQAARVSVVSEVVRNYVDLRFAQRRLDLMQRAATNSAEKIALTETRVRLRLASADDLARLQAAQASAEADLYEPRLAIDIATLQLAVLTGQDRPDSSLLVAAAPPELGDVRVATAPADLLRTRPEIRRAENDVLKAAGELGLARADRFPRIGLGGSLTYSAKVIGRSRLANADGIVTFGPAIEIPLFDWGMRKAVEEANDAELSASVLAYRQAVLQGVAETETAMATLEHQRERSIALGRSLTALDKVDRSTQTLRRLGLADDVDRVDAAAALLQTRLESAQAQHERSIAFVALYKALGGAPLPDDTLHRDSEITPETAADGAASQPDATH